MSTEFIPAYTVGFMNRFIKDRQTLKPCAVAPSAVEYFVMRDIYNGTKIFVQDERKPVYTHDLSWGLGSGTDMLGIFSKAGIELVKVKIPSDDHYKDAYVVASQVKAMHIKSFPFKQNRGVIVFKSGRKLESDMETSVLLGALSGKNSSCATRPEAKGKVSDSAPVVA